MYCLVSYSTANPDRLILKEADYPADRNQLDEESVGPQITHDISVN